MISTHPPAQISRKIGAQFLYFYVQGWISGVGDEEVQIWSDFGRQIDRKLVIIDVNRVVVAPFRLIFNQNEDTGPRNVFRPLRGPKTAIFDPKTTKNTIFGIYITPDPDTPPQGGRYVN